MFTDNTFKFTLNVSNEGYEKKTDATACLSSKGAEAINRKKMCFFENSLTVDEFLDKAQSGHSFCALFRFEEDTKYWYSNKKGQKFYGFPHYRRNSKTSTLGGLKIDFKRDEYFSGSQVVFIDIDFTKYTDINDYINALTFKPTMVYMSYSDGKDKGGKTSRRFHLCYVFDSILNDIEFKNASITLSNALVTDTNEELDDKCGEKMSQYMNGCYGNSENYKTYSIYSYKDIEEYNNNIEYVEEVEELDNSTTFNLKLENEEIEAEEVIEDEKDERLELDERILNDFDRLELEEFEKQRDWVNYLHTTKYIWRVEKDEWEHGTYQFVDDNYFRLFFYVNTQKDGSKRRRNLYQRMCLRRIIKPTITAKELAFNAIVDIIRFYDNSDGLLNGDFIRRNVINALQCDNLEDELSSAVEYLKAVTKPKKGIIYKNRKAHTKQATYQILDDLYDFDKSVTENLALMELLGFPIKKSTIYNYLKERGIKADNNKLTDEEVITYINFGDTAIDNYNFIKSLGFKISKNRLFKIYKNNKNNVIGDNSSIRTTTFNLKMEKEELLLNDELEQILDGDTLTTEDIKSNIYCLVELRKQHQNNTIERRALNALPSNNTLDFSWL